LALRNVVKATPISNAGAMLRSQAMQPAETIFCSVAARVSAATTV